MPVNIVNNTDAIKRQDNITPIELLLTDDNNANYPIDGKTVKAWFSNETGFLYEKELTERDGQKLIIRIDPDEVNKIGIGKIKMEIVVEESDRQKIFPNGSYIEFEIVRNLKSINGNALNPITLEFFEQEFADLKLVADTSIQSANKAVESVNAAIESVNATNENAQTLINELNTASEHIGQEIESEINKRDFTTNEVLEQKVSEVTDRIGLLGVGGNSINEVADLDTVSTGGAYYYAATAKGRPTESAGIVHNTPGLGNEVASQLALSLNGEFRTRVKINNVWQEWTEPGGYEDAQWETLTPLGGAQPFLPTTPPQFLRNGNKIILSGALKGLVGYDVSVLSLPSGIAPSREWNFVQNTSVKNGVAQFARWSIGTDGSMKMQRNSSGVYESTDWYPIFTEYVLN